MARTRSATASRPRAGAFAPASPATQEDVRSASRPRSPSASKRARRADRISRAGQNQGRNLSRTEPQDAGRKAISGDLTAAELALKILARAERYGDPGVDPILVENWMPDCPGQTANQKTDDVAAGRDATPAEWWRSSRIERRAKFTMSVPSRAPGRRIVARAAASGQVNAYWALQPHRFKALRCGQAVRQDGVRQDLDCAGARARGGMRLVRAPAYDLVGSVSGFDANAPADRRVELEDAAGDPAGERRPHRLLVAGESDRRPRPAISTRRDRRGGIHQRRRQPRRRFDDGAVGKGDQADLIRLWRRGARLLEFRGQEPGQLLLQYLH